MGTITCAGSTAVAEEFAPPKPSALPFISVILPVYNEERAISRVLYSLLDQDYPRHRMEILVVDGMSTDETRRKVNAAAVDSRVRLLNNPRRIMAAGFNLGLKASRGDIIVMMGGHTEIARDYLKCSASLLQQGFADCVGGPIHTVGETDAARAISLAMSCRFGVGGVAFRVGCEQRKYVDTVAYGAYTRSIIERTGMLDEEFVRNQDDEFNYRLRKLGGKILIAPELNSTYTSRSSMRSLWLQYFRYGYWKVRVLQKHPRQLQWRQFAPMAFVVSLLLGLILTVLRPEIGVRFTLFTIGSYLMATLYVTGLLVRRSNWKFAPLLFVSFPVLHLSYGIGFLVGLVKFSNRWRNRESTGRSDGNGFSTLLGSRH